MVHRTLVTVRTDNNIQSQFIKDDIWQQWRSDIVYDKATDSDDLDTPDDVCQSD